ncbi:MAG: glycosyltransferase family 2 protein [Prevotella sp.]
MSTPKLSIIIPLYNCEKYIRQCLDSIYRQNIVSSDFEVIIVDDGSKDGGFSLVSDYSVGHNNITVIKQDNQGVACARNNAIKKATGDYVTFVDADDMLAEGSLNTLLHIAIDKNADIVKAAHVEVPQEAVFGDYSPNDGNNNFIEVMTGEDAIVRVTKLKEGYCWGYLISRQLIMDNELCFPPKVSFMEDWAFITQALLKCRTFVNAGVLFYLYRHNTTSCVANMSTEKLLLGCRSIDIVAKAASSTHGAVRKKLADNVCENINIVLWFTIHYKRIYCDRKEISKTLCCLLQQVEKQYISGTLQLFKLLPDMYIILRHLLASRKY